MSSTELNGTEIAEIHYFMYSFTNFWRQPPNPFFFTRNLEILEISSKFWNLNWNGKYLSIEYQNILVSLTRNFGSVQMINYFPDYSFHCMQWMSLISHDYSNQKVKQGTLVCSVNIYQAILDHITVFPKSQLCSLSSEFWQSMNWSILFVLVLGQQFFFSLFETQNETCKIKWM